MHELFWSVSFAVIAAAFLGVICSLIRAPLIVAYIGAGMILGPHAGFSVIKSPESIATMSNLGLVLLMFILGLEIHLGKLLRAGKAVAFNGIIQFTGCLLLVGLAALPLIQNHFEMAYLAFAGAMSSTLIVVKILSDRLEIDSLPSRITLGVLVIQDLFAVLFLAFQPNLAHPDVWMILSSLTKALLLVGIGWVGAKWILPRILHRLATHSELLLIVSLSWCFAMAAIAHALHLSGEMGALIAGVAVAAFPYHADLASRIASLRDFFITLFFVALGLQLEIPNTRTLGLAALLIGAVWLSRFLILVPLNQALGYGRRIGILLSINLGQVSEFAVVFTALGVGLGHVTQELLAAVLVAHVVTILISTYVIPHAHVVARRFGQKVQHGGNAKPEVVQPAPSFVFLGFYRESSSFLESLKAQHDPAFLQTIEVLDYNPETLSGLRRMGVKAHYADLSHSAALSQARLKEAQYIVCLLKDYQLKGTSNFQLCTIVKSIAPEARLIFTADSLHEAERLYKAGATYVYIPRLIGAHYLADVIERMAAGEVEAIRQGAQEYLAKKAEVVA